MKTILCEHESGGSFAGRRWALRSEIIGLSALLAATLISLPLAAKGDCSLTTTGNVPLPDLGSNTYQGFEGGLYPDGSNAGPVQHQTAGVAQGGQVKPLDATGAVDDSHGLIGLISIGMTNASEEWASGGDTAFKPRADADPSKDPQVTIADGAQDGKDAIAWADPNNDAWTTLAQRLSAAGVSAAQVQVVWMNLDISYPMPYGAFPAHAKVLQADIESIVRTLKSRYPNVQIVYLASRTRAYTDDPAQLSPEPFAYETGFAVQWAIADQINGIGNLNFDPSVGTVVAPYLTWGPYLWVDGTNPRSDGLTWLCSDLQSDFILPSSTGVGKVANQLLTFFKSDPTAAAWFLKKKLGAPPTVDATAIPAGGQTNVAIQFTSNASDPLASISTYSWTFDDGTFSTAKNPVKIFPAAGLYNVHLTVTNVNGDYVTATLPVNVGTGTSNLLNVSARLQVGTGNDVAISGFIVTGPAGTKQVLIRALGPSLAPLGVAGSLQDPYLELHNSVGATIATNDNWETTVLGGEIISDQVTVIRATGLAPTDGAESAILVDLVPGAYTAVARGADGGTGVGLVEVYNLNQQSPAVLSNLSTRGFVETGASVLIGGFIVGGSDMSTVVLRALGPSLLPAGVLDYLADPTLELHDANGALLASNDNWADTQQTEILASGLAPGDPLEAAIESTLAPGNYTAIVTGKNGGVGVSLMEIYKLQ
ncbi:MAG: PKD domain-containing protein [Chthoniobacterales bacterium]